MGITNPGEGYFKNGGWGWDGTQWRKLPMVWGYTDVYRERVVDTTAAAGTNYLDSSTVPAGEVWVLTNVVVWDLTSIQTQIILSVLDGVGTYSFYWAFSPAAQWVGEWQGFIVLQAGEYVRTSIYGCVLNDSIGVTYLGYKMKVA